MTTNTRKIDKDQLLAWGLPYGYDWEDQKAEILATEDGDHGRWESYHTVIFVAPDDGKTYSADYSRGLTEYQDTRPWEDVDYVTCVEVEARTRVVEITDWVPVKYTEPHVPTQSQLVQQWAWNREDDMEAVEW